MVITGRLTADAETAELKDGRKVVNFRMAINDRYRTKSGETMELTSFVSCSYWISTGVAQILKKGALVELFGRLDADAYIDREGNPVGRLNFHVNNIKLLAGARKQDSFSDRPLERISEDSTGISMEEAKDDLPF
ncbi:single-stranded DNA-binding protein [Aquiflexum lacus]|uniref:single-stranded DNA-binding protein n=1 Tax=Aquiflexum lacus TaxID=2483805 RepID=UPI0018930A1B|nr:single-stranded DNA-binding protein [Aquiflexum lacus]